MFLEFRKQKTGIGGQSCIVQLLYSMMVDFSPTFNSVAIIPPSGNPIKCHEEVLSLQPKILPTKRFDMFSPLTGRCSEGLDTFIFFFKQ